MVRDTHATIDLTVPVRKDRDKITSDATDLDDGSRVSWGFTEDLPQPKFTATYRIEDVEAAARAMFHLVNDDPYRVIDTVLPEEITDDEMYSPRYPAATIKVRHVSNEAVFLTAKRYAAEKTKNSMSHGYGVSFEQVLLWWAKTAPFSDDEASNPRVDTVVLDKLSTCADNILNHYVFDHTPGGPIDADQLPDHDEWCDDPTREEMRPAETVE